jgi:PTH2 family peptidyl-tRNA hydrolase
MNTKQVIILRRDLKMRRGKEIAQGSHASMAFLTRDLEFKGDFAETAFSGNFENNWYGPEQAKEILYWLENSFRKIVCYVNSEEELEEIHKKALDSGLISHMVIDNGATEFNGAPTKTCIAIGPCADEKFEGITDHLPLL